MIYYLLYPFRRTVQPPLLHPKHPLRHNFTQYGHQACRHPIVTLLVSVAVACLFTFPFGYLYANDSANGTSNLPHHVWTTAQPFVGDSAAARVDVVMRTIWIHGTYMKALEKDVLQRGLQIQDELLGPTLNFNPRQDPQHLPLNPYDSAAWTTQRRDSMHAVNGPSNFSWFFHSPLKYWSCSPEAIADDQDVITTVNQGSHQSTSVNVTLRHSIVFSGKRFEDHRLVAADALVITLIHRPDSPVGTWWETKAMQIAEKHSDQWRLFPANGVARQNSLYEFRFQPLSPWEDLLYALGYGAAAVYFFFNLSKMRALKSRTGLCIAALCQFVASMISSFTICAIVKIDLSKIPREFYPAVVIASSIENIFQLIDALIATPAQLATPLRMAEALGQVGHIILANFAQRMFLLGALAYWGSPEVAAFCIFAMLALVFDLFYLVTFFVGVLSIDIRRKDLDLSDPMIRERSRQDPSLDKRFQWVDEALRGKSPVSTRIAGILVIIVAVLMVNSHFHDGSLELWQLLKSLYVERRDPFERSNLSVGINQARTPTEWLRMQDHETAHEVIQVIKPNAHSYIARVYEPLIFVLTGSDRTPTEFGVRQFLPASYDFMRHHKQTLLCTLVGIIAVLCFLMNYALRNQPTEEDPVDRPDDQPLLTVQTLQGHDLDIAKLKGSRSGVVVSVGLDRKIQVWNIKTQQAYLIHDPTVDYSPFPVLALAIDNCSNWLAFLSAKDEVRLWNIPERRWGPLVKAEVNRRVPEAFFFSSDQTHQINPVVVIVRHNGMMTELDMEINVSMSLQICRSPLVSVKPHPEKLLHDGKPPPLRILTSSKYGCVHVASQMESGWISEDVQITPPVDDPEILSIVPLPILSSFLAVRGHSVDLIDIWTRQVTHTFKTRPMIHGSIRYIHSTRRRPQCGSVGLGFFCIAYTSSDSGDLILQSYLPERAGDTICFRDPYKPGSKTCCLWRETIEETYTVENPGAWEALQFGYIVGVRNKNIKLKTSVKTTPESGLRRRGGTERKSSRLKEPKDEWEVWSLSANGARSSTPLNQSDAAGSGQLLATQLGPVERVGSGSIAVGLGNVVKVVVIQGEKFDGAGFAGDAAFVGMRPSTHGRRRRGA